MIIRQAFRPFGVLDHLAWSFYNQFLDGARGGLGGLGDQSRPVVDSSERIGELLSAQSSIFIDFLTTQINIEKMKIFRTLKNQPRWLEQSILGGPGSDLC